MQDLPIKDKSMTVLLHIMCSLFTEQLFNFTLTISIEFLEDFLANINCKYS